MRFLLWACVATIAVVDGTAVPWVLENACVLALACVKCWLLQRFEHLAPLLVFGASNLVLVEGTIAIQALLNAMWYRSVPVFHARAPGHSLQDMVANVMRSTVPVHVLTTVAVALLCAVVGEECTLPHDYSLADDLASLSFGAVCAKFAAFRLVSDVAFYATHRAQHHPRLYAWTHSRHHQHRRTSLRTNFQFTSVDLMLEGSVPSLVAGVALSPCTTFSPLELGLFMGYVQWYQIGSHSAKDVNSVTALPPLAPLVNWSRLRPLRPAALRHHRHIRFHAAHHRAVTGNYGISPWMDVLLGTVVPQATKDSASS